MFRADPPSIDRVKLVLGSFELSNMHCMLDFCPNQTGSIQMYLRKRVAKVLLSNLYTVQPGNNHHLMKLSMSCHELWLLPVLMGRGLIIDEHA